jgi:RNA polymerase sigma factor (sigma-70 family)
MTPRPLQSILHHLRRAVNGGQAGDPTDAELLDDFLRQRDERAFELLVWRHAAMVFAVCRRVLRDRQEAEDAFQATFLVFVRKAASIRQRDSVAGWLHRVAFRIAQRARGRAAKRPGPLPGEDVPDRESPDAVLWRDLRPVLDEEINRLPEKYRRPFVLCCLEGNTNEQAARQLGCPKGTILSRLARGRERLRARLARRGLALSGSLLATMLIARASEAAAPAALVSTTVKAAIPFAAGTAAASLVAARPAAWTEGVLKAMFMTKLEISAAVVLVLALAGTGAGLLAPPLLAEPRATSQDRPPADGRRERGDGRAAPLPEVRGVVKAVDNAKNTITVAVTDGRRETVEKTFPVSKTAEVAVGAGLGRGMRGTLREGKLADLAPGAMVSLLLDAEQKVVETIVAEGPVVRGVVKAVDADKKTVTLTLPTHQARGRGEEAPPPEEKTYTLGPKTEIGVDDGQGRLFSLKAVKLVDLPVGALATLKLSVNGQQVLTLVAEGSTASGTVKAVDAGKKQITLTGRAGRGDVGSEEKAFDLASEATVLIDDGKGRRFSVKEGKLEDVPAGALVALKLAADQKTATTLLAEGPSVQGPVKAVDADKRTITVVTGRARDGSPVEDKTFSVARDARILIDGKESKLADIKAEENGPPVGLKLSLDQKVVQSITIGGRGR